MRIGIITDTVRRSALGVHNYIQSLVTNLLKIDTENNYTLIYSDPCTIENFVGGNRLKVFLLQAPLGKEFRQIITMPRILRKEGFDIVHDLFHFGPYFLPGPYKKVITIHDIIPLLVERRAKDVIRYQIGLSLMLRNVDKIIAISESTKEDLVSHLGVSEVKIVVVDPGIDHVRFRPLHENADLMKKYGIPKGKKRVLYIGSERPRKNLSTLIKAFYELKKRLEDVVLIKAGEPRWPSGRDVLIKLISQLGLQQDIVFCGHIPYEEMPRLYSIADVLVFPSLHEGFGLPLLEAMACGVPVIATRIPPFMKVLGSNAGITVDPHECKRLTGAMYQVLTNPDLREEMIGAGLERARMFSWEQTARKTLEVYQELQSN